MLRFGVPVVVSINRFSSDHEGELEVLEASAIASGAHAVVRTTVHGEGGAGGSALARAVVGACQDHLAAGRPFTPLIDASMGILDQTERIATELYGADGILVEPAAKRQLDRFVKWGYGTLPVCMAKTQYSLSHDPSLLGAPTGFTVPVREFRLNAGAGFIVAILGNMMTMPGLPARPAAAEMDIDEHGNLVGMFS